MQKLVRHTEIYTADFTIAECLLLRNQFQTFILNVRRSVEFCECRYLAKVAQKMVDIGKKYNFCIGVLPHRAHIDPSSGNNIS